MNLLEEAVYLTAPVRSNFENECLLLTYSVKIIYLFNKSVYMNKGCHEIIVYI